jgi:hypothetical protein
LPRRRGRPSPCSSTAAGGRRDDREKQARKQGRGGGSRAAELETHAWICRFAGQGDEEDDEPTACSLLRMELQEHLHRCRPPQSPGRLHPPLKVNPPWPRGRRLKEKSRLKKPAPVLYLADLLPGESHAGEQEHLRFASSASSLTWRRTTPRPAAA